MTHFARISLLTASAFLAAALFAPAPVAAQTLTPSTTLCAAVAVNDQNICIASTTNVVARTGFYIDLEYVQVLTAPVGTTNVYVKVARGLNATSPAAHANSQTAWLALTPDKSVVPGANGFNFGAAFTDYGPCVRSQHAYLPHIWPARAEIIDCDATTLRWAPYNQTFTLAVSASECAWSTTGTWDAQVAVATGGPFLLGPTAIGASLIPVNQVKTTSAGASVNTLTCIIPINVYQPLINKGITVKYADFIYGVATTTLTSISGGAFSTITVPAPGATQTASTVTPVAVGGSVTTSSTTSNLAATTAGAFRTSRLTPATPINLTTDQQFFIVSENFNQSASAAQVVNALGLLLHYTIQQR